jgi:hypothetical protein
VNLVLLQISTSLISQAAGALVNKKEGFYEFGTHAVLLRPIWLVIQLVLTLFSPCGITNIFGNLLNGIDNRFKKHIRVGAIAFIWSLWLYRNDKVFNDKNSSILQVIYRAISTLRLWSSLQRLEDRDFYWKLRRGILFPNMDDHIAYVLVQLFRRNYNCSL